MKTSKNFPFKFLKCGDQVSVMIVLDEEVERVEELGSFGRQL